MARLYCKGRVLGHARGKRNSKPIVSLLEIDGVTSAEQTPAYLGKRVAYVYRTKNGPKVIWGVVSRPHGKSGAVRAKFSSSLPPHSFGASCRIMLFPSNI